VAIVSESFAEQNRPGENPLGKQVTGGGMDNFYTEQRFARVVGVVGDALFRDLGREKYPTVYFPYTQRPFRIRFGAGLVVETASGDPAGIVPDLNSLALEADPEIPLSVRTYPSIISVSLTERRFIMMILAGFSLTALVLSAVGIFGVVSYVVALRTREMGIRMALGADPRKLLRSVMGGALGMVAGGVLVGLVGMVGAFLVTRTIRTSLYQVSPLDPLAVFGAALLLVGTAVLATWLPARSVTRVDPMISMRAE